MIKTGQCKLCRGYYTLTNGRLPKHQSIKTDKPCRGRLPDTKYRPEDYPEGFDYDPWVMSGGLPERNRSKF